MICSAPRVRNVGGLVGGQDGQSLACLGLVELDGGVAVNCGQGSCLSRDLFWDDSTTSPDTVPPQGGNDKQV
jgi:hypothetical protein